MAKSTRHDVLIMPIDQCGSSIESACSLYGGTKNGKRKWKKRYVVIQQREDVVNGVFVNVHKTETLRRKALQCVLPQALQEAYGYESGFELAGERWTLAIFCQKQKTEMIMAFPSHDILVYWETWLRAALRFSEMFFVQLVECPRESPLKAYKSIDFRMHIHDDRLCLVQGCPPRICAAFAFTSLRQYGFFFNQFHFESGERGVPEAAGMYKISCSQLHRMQVCFGKAIKGELHAYLSRREASPEAPWFQGTSDNHPQANARIPGTMASSGTHVSTMTKLMTTPSPQRAGLPSSSSSLPRQRTLKSSGTPITNPADRPLPPPFLHSKKISRKISPTLDKENTFRQQDEASKSPRNEFPAETREVHAKPADNAAIAKKDPFYENQLFIDNLPLYYNMDAVMGTDCTMNYTPMLPSPPKPENVTSGDVFRKLSFLSTDGGGVSRGIHTVELHQMKSNNGRMSISDDEEAADTNEYLSFDPDLAIAPRKPAEIETNATAEEAERQHEKTRAYFAKLVPPVVPRHMPPNWRELRTGESSHDTSGNSRPQSADEIQRLDQLGHFVSDSDMHPRFYGLDRRRANSDATQQAPAMRLSHQQSMSVTGSAAESVSGPDSGSANSSRRNSWSQTAKRLMQKLTGKLLGDDQTKTSAHRQSTDFLPTVPAPPPPPPQLTARPRVVTKSTVEPSYHRHHLQYQRQQFGGHNNARLHETAFAHHHQPSPSLDSPASMSRRTFQHSSYQSAGSPTAQPGRGLVKVAQQSSTNGNGNHGGRHGAVGNAKPILKNVAVSLRRPLTGSYSKYDGDSSGSRLPTPVATATPASTTTPTHFPVFGGDNIGSAVKRKQEMRMMSDRRPSTVGQDFVTNSSSSSPVGGTHRITMTTDAGSDRTSSVFSRDHNNGNVNPIETPSSTSSSTSGIRFSFPISASHNTHLPSTSAAASLAYSTMDFARAPQSAPPPIRPHRRQPTGGGNQQHGTMYVEIDPISTVAVKDATRDRAEQHRASSMQMLNRNNSTEGNSDGGKKRKHRRLHVPSGGMWKKTGFRRRFSLGSESPDKENK